MGKKWTDEEKRLTREAITEADLALKYLNYFGECNKDRVHSLFSHRQRLLLEDKMQKTITSVQSEQKLPAFSDDVVLVNISNKISLIEIDMKELIRIQKEMIELFRANLPKKE